MSELNRSLIIRKLDSRVTEDVLKSIFDLISPTLSIKIEKDPSNTDFNCGFVEFHEHQTAEQAYHTMDGRIIHGQSISIEWNHTGPSIHSRRSSSNSDEIILSNISYEELFAETPLYHTSICISNLPKETIRQDVAPYLQQYGFVSDIHMLPNKRRAIVRLDTHANAATAIIALQDTMIAGNKVRLRWAKEERQEQTDSPTRSFNVFSSGYEHPKELVNQITNTYENHTTTRPPAPTFDASMDTEEGLHGWNQYYQQYYSAGHITI